MSADKHTPGPWRQHNWRVVDAQGEGGICTTVICDTANNKTTRTPENLANARLIAAAPDMLGALEAVGELLQAGAVRVLRTGNHGAPDWAMSVLPLVNKLSLVISKARGEE